MNRQSTFRHDEGGKRRNEAKKLEGALQQITATVGKIEEFLEQSFKWQSDEDAIAKQVKLQQLVKNVGFGTKKDGKGNNNDGNKDGSSRSPGLYK